MAIIILVCNTSVYLYNMARATGLYNIAEVLIYPVQLNALLMPLMWIFTHKELTSQYMFSYKTIFHFIPSVALLLFASFYFADTAKEEFAAMMLNETIGEAKTPGVIAILPTALAATACSNPTDRYDATGVFEATEVTVSANGNGEIISLQVTDGARLTAGEAVGCIDTMQLHLRKRQLDANLTARSRYRDLDRQLAPLQQQIATQQTEKQRFEQLVEASAANQKQLDDISAQLSLLEKELSARTEALEKSNRSIDAEVTGLEAQREQIADQLSKSVIRSPLQGVVPARYAEQGEFATQGRALFKVGDTEHLFLRAYITAPQLTDVKLGQEVSVYADQGENGRRTYKGTVSWISDQAEFTPKSIQTRDERSNLVYAIKVSVENDGYIKCGMYGEVKL